MKRICFLLALLITTSVFAHTSAFDIRWGDSTTYESSSSNRLKQWAEGMEGRVGVNPGTGSIFYVDSGVQNEGDGSSWDNARDTLQEAIDLCSDNRGDRIWVAQGHAETWSLTGATADVDVEGVTIIGVGDGNDRPAFISTHTGAYLHMNAANTTIVNILFVNGVDNQTKVVEVSADDVSIFGCEFRDGSATSYLDSIHTTNSDGGSDRLHVDSCVFYNPGGNSDAPIHIEGDQVGIQITNNYIYGDYDLGGIYLPANADASINLMIHENTITNIQGSGYGISISGTGSTVSFRNNTIYVDVPENAYSFDQTIARGEVVVLSRGEVADGTGVYPESVANDSLWAKIMSKSETADANTFNNTSDSLEAIADAIGAEMGLTDNNLDHLMLEPVTDDAGDIDLAEVVDKTVLSWIIAGDGDTATFVPSTMALSVQSTNIDSTLEDTNELQEDWANGGRLDLLIDGIKSQTDANITLILADSNELQTDWADDGRLDLLIDAILNDTGTTGVLIADGALTPGAVAEEAIDAGAIATDAIGSEELAAAAVTKIWENDVSAYAGAGYAGTYVKTLYDDWLNDGRLDLILDDVLVELAEVDVNVTLALTEIAEVDVNVTAILTELAEVDVNVTAVLDDTTALLLEVAEVDVNVTLVLTELAEVDVNVTAVLTELAEVDVNVTATLTELAEVDVNVTAVLTELAEVDVNVTLALTELSGGDGIASFPAAVQAADAVSIAEVLRYVQEKQLPRMELNANADLTGYDTADWFNVTGDVMVRVVGVVGSVAITTTGGAATLSVGTAEDSDAILAATVMDNADFAVTDVWVDNNPEDDCGVMDAAVNTWHIIGGGANIQLANNLDDIEGGKLTLYCWWKPLSADGDVTVTP